MAKKATLPQDESYFVSVKNPLEVRKQVLESSKKALYTMQNYHRILILREQKLREVAALKESLKELVYLNKKLNDKLPKYDVSLLHKDAPKKDVPIEEPAPKKAVKKPAREKTELEKLEDSLAAIEDKLKSLPE